MTQGRPYFVYTQIRFDWDRHKAASNQNKHGVTFEDAATVFFDVAALDTPTWRIRRESHVRCGSGRRLTVV